MVLATPSSPSSGLSGQSTGILHHKRYGTALSVYSIMLTCLPQMNFAVVLFGGVMLLSLVNYLVSAHRVYKGPVALVKVEERSDV